MNRSPRRIAASSRRKYSTNEGTVDTIALNVQEVSDIEVAYEEVKPALPLPRNRRLMHLQQRHRPNCCSSMTFADLQQFCSSTTLERVHARLRHLCSSCRSVLRVIIVSANMALYEKEHKAAGSRRKYTNMVYASVDYFSKRFFRVYPLFAITAIIVAFLPFDEQHRYFLVEKPGDFNLFKVLTFEFHHRFFVLWTLPLEIAYYFIIPVFVVVMLKIGRWWWTVVAGLSIWVVHEGWNKYRTSHSPFLPHIPTFLSGSLAAVVFIKLDLLITRKGFKFRKWHTLLLRVVEGSIISLLLSVCFRGLLFDWVHKNPARNTPSFPYVSAYLVMLFVIEMIHRSCVSTMFEWSVLRNWGKISFSVYLLHSFIIWNPTISGQPKYYNRLFSRIFLLLLLASESYHLIEYPSQLIAQRISKTLTKREKAKSDEWAGVVWLNEKLNH